MKILKETTGELKNLPNFNYKNAYADLIKKLQESIDMVNASDYSKKSLGRFKEHVEKILSDVQDIY